MLTDNLNDFRRTAITAMQMAGVSEKEASVLVGATPEVMRKHYERLDQLAIAGRVRQRRLAGANGVESSIEARLERAGEINPLDDRPLAPQAV
jgi:hypothetical protein